MKNSNLPELLAPAGSPESLRAAVSAGADAVYFGAKNFSARAFAENFDEDGLSAAIRYCLDFGVKPYITVNTQLFGREMTEAIQLIRRARNMGASAFIVADLGLAEQVHLLYPEIELHASTQMSGQNAFSAKALKQFGFSRMVAPREISCTDLKLLCASSPLETEIFVHGALCASCSGQCLISSVIGGRSGNRGQCAQPCRLPYDGGYRLSLKDLCLADYITDFIDFGVSSLKIEGRMKSPDYVYGVTKIYRKLLGERRNATPEETKELASLFSRSGFTCGYYTGQIDSKMLGVRTADDKRESACASGAPIPEKKIPISFSARLEAGAPAELTGRAFVGGADAVRTVSGGEVRSADVPMGAERVISALSKLGGTVFETSPDKIEIEIGESSQLSMAELNAMRRGLCEKLADAALPERNLAEKLPEQKSGGRIFSDKKTAYFADAKSITESASEYFDAVFVPIAEYEKARPIVHAEKLGIAFPPVAYDSELEAIVSAARRASMSGCKKALITGLWQIAPSKDCGFEMTGDMRLNVCNSFSAEALVRLGVNDIILSCEIGLLRAAAINAKIRAGVIAYGRLPLMTLEKCVIRDIENLKAPCAQCRFCDGGKSVFLTDRTGAEFLLKREEKHRNVLYNSVPVWMADKLGEITASGFFTHCIFTDETAVKTDSVIAALKRGDAPVGGFKRI